MTYETVLEVVFDGTDRAPLGRLLFPPTLPAPVRPRYVLPMDVVPAPTPVPQPAPKGAAPRRAGWAQRRGVVHAAKDRVWQLLEFPRTSRDIFEALGLPENAVSSMLVRGVRLGVLAYAGDRPNELRGVGQRRWVKLYRRAPGYAHAKTWPYAANQRRERAA